MDIEEFRMIEVRLDSELSYCLRLLSIRSGSEVAVLKMFKGTNQLYSLIRQGKFVFNIHNVFTWFMQF